MSLINAAFAAAAAAFVVPLLIHLLYRGRVRPVRWGAMHLLSDVAVTTRRKVQADHWLLLAIRCLIPVVLAFALARPLIEGLAGGDDGRHGLVLVIDNSSSMSATAVVDGQTRSVWQSAMDASIDLVTQMGDADPIAIIPSGQAGSVVGVGDVDDAITTLQRLRPEAAGTSISDMVRAGLAAAESIEAAVTSIVVVTDASQSVFDAVDDDGSLGRLMPPREDVDLTILPILIDGQSHNVMVDRPRADPVVPIAGRVVSWTTEIRNRSDQPVAGVMVRVRDDDQTVHRQTIDIDAGGSQQVVWTTPAKEVGSSSLDVEMDVQDDLAADNDFKMIYRTIDAIAAVIVDDGPGAENRRQRGSIVESAGGYLSVALAPGSVLGGSQEVAEIVRTQTIGSDALSSLLRQSVPPAVVFITHATRWDAGSPRLLARYVRGGGRVVLMGDLRMDESTINALSTQLPLPAVYEGLIKKDRDRETLSEVVAGSIWEPLRIGPIRFGIGAMHRMRIDAENEAETQVWWRTASGTPLAVYRPVGRGGVLQLALSADRTMSQWPLHASMLLMMQSFVLDAAVSSEQRNVVVGQRLSAKIPVADRSGSGWQWRLPDGQTEPAVVSVAGSITGAGTSAVEAPADDPSIGLTTRRADRPGQYELLRMASDDASPEKDIRRFVAAVDPGESRLGRVSMDRLRSIAQQIGGVVHRDVDEFGRRQTVLVRGREIWRPLVWLLLALMIAELIWQQRRSGVRR